MQALHTAPTARIAALLLAAVLGACAQTAKPQAAARTDGSRCQQIAAEIERTEAERRGAVEKGDTAWKAVLPFAVVGRKLSSKADADLAAKKLAELQQQSRSAGCAEAHARSTR